LRIKKLELIGFKSFKDRTVIQFDQGITGIVGPNGCGKSNIVDALVWVMGEMSAKHLRGSSMSDVIFGGAEGYAPLGMAEVSLTLENDGGPFPAAYQRFSEVMVTRRLHRNGESEYLINKEPARLRDIQEVFMDTGAGSKGFSIIEQGAIGKIVTSKPEDRRVLIEEAAGITKFKVRKRESQRKLEATDQNLIRLQDIIGEQKRQLDSLERQAQRAERYRKLKTELQDKELWLTSRQYLNMHEESSQAEAIFNSARDEEALHSGGINELELNVQALRLNVAEADTRVQDKQREHQEMTYKVQENEMQMRELNFAIEQARRSNEVTGSILSQYNMRKTNLANEKEKVEGELTDARLQALELETAFNFKNDEFARRQERVTAADKELTDKRREMLTVGAGLSQLEAREQVLQQRISDESARVEQSNNLLQELIAKKSEFEGRRKTVFNRLEGERQMQMDIVKDVELITENLNGLRSQVGARREEAEGLKEELNQVASHLYGLENLQSNFEGFEEGVKNVLMWQRQAEGLNGVEFKPVAEVVEVPAKYELAMEAALGQRLQMLLNANGDIGAVDGAVNHLKSQQAGRASFALSSPAMTRGLFGAEEASNQNASAIGTDSFSQSLSGSDGFNPAYSGGLETVETTLLEPLRAEEGFDNFLKDVVAIPAEFRASIERFFADVVVVTTIQAAIRLSKSYPGRTFVTLDGDTLSSDGVLTGGATGSADTGVIRRRREIKELSSKREELAGKTQLAQLSLKRVEDQLKGIEEQLESAKKNSIEKEILVAELRKDLERAEMELNNANNAFEREQRENDRQSLNLMSLQEQVANLQSELIDLRTQKVELEARVEVLTKEVTEIRTGIEERQKEVMELRASSASRRQEVEGLERQMLLVSTSLSELESQLSQMSAESERNTETLSSSQIAVENLQSETTRLIHLSQESHLQLGQVKNAYEEVQAHLRAREEEFQTKQSRIYQLRSTLNETQLKAEQLRMKEAFLSEQILEKYQLVLREIAPGYAEKTVDEASGMPLAEEIVMKEVDELKDKVKRIGEVNLAAIQEYDELSTRYQFLSQQHQDLIEAKEHLRKVIDRINRICTKRFRETFELVNERFTKVFPVLFGGGEAKLILVESPDDDPGIEIVAKPPGKKPQSITLLSGGEKALTAVSLIFSIFLVKPSPFCLLDEVDAPLDDANVYRFNDLVREMAKRSQIIVVTHNKHTMKMNDKLYGVTMQEKGVSKMVSVSIAEAVQTVAG
jgi:chromosome segregation protein